MDTNLYQQAFIRMADAASIPVDALKYKADNNAEFKRLKESA